MESGGGRSVKLISESSESRLAPAVTARSRKSEYVHRLGAGWVGRAADMGPVGSPGDDRFFSAQVLPQGAEEQRRFDLATPAREIPSLPCERARCLR